MESRSAKHTLYDFSRLEETECALAISPCPQLNAAKDAEEVARSARTDDPPHGRRRVQARRQPVVDDHDLTETLGIGWAISLAISVALIILVSGG